MEFIFLRWVTCELCHRLSLVLDNADGFWKYEFLKELCFSWVKKYITHVTILNGEKSKGNDTNFFPISITALVGNMWVGFPYIPSCVFPGFKNNQAVC